MRKEALERARAVVMGEAERRCPLVEGGFSERGCHAKGEFCSLSELFRANMGGDQRKRWPKR